MSGRYCVLALFLVACGSDSGSPSDTTLDTASDSDVDTSNDSVAVTDSSGDVDTDTVIGPGSANYSASLGAGPDFSQPHSRFVVTTFLGESYIGLSGSFHDGPPVRFHAEDQRVGNCRVVRFTASTCTPSCTSEQACLDTQCVDYPTRPDRGDIAWTWVDGSQRVTRDAVGGYFAQGTTESHGATSIENGSVTLTAPTVAPLIASGDWSQAFADRVRGEDVTLLWSNPQSDARVRLRMTDCVGSHGGISAAEIECEGPDTGCLTLAGALIDIIEDGDWSRGECGSHDLDRYHAAAPDAQAQWRLETIGRSGFFYFPRGD